MKKVVSMLTIMLVLCTQLAYASADSHATTESAVSIHPTDSIMEAKDIISELQQGNSEELYSRFDDTVKAQVTVSQVGQIWGSLVSSFGKYVTMLGSNYIKSGEYDVVVITLQFEKANMDAIISFNSAGKVAGLGFNQSSNTAKPADPIKAPDNVIETDVTVGKGEWVLPGTLSMPKGKGPFPAVVLVQGSGPCDRDETVGPNKPFRDIAWELAAHGVAVLRYDKRTKVYAKQLSSMTTDFTVKEETIDDVLAAYKLLEGTKNINKNKIFVLGHSLGGMLIPRIGLQIKNAAGFIVLAGPNRPMEDLILEQEQYIFSLDQSTTEAQKQQVLDQIIQQVNNIKHLQSGSKLTADELLGAPASYWIDLKGYVPAAAAQKLNKPMLILQGLRDYQVTSKDLSVWKSMLQSKKNVTFKTYNDLNHLFITGKGKSTPNEYNVEGHVSQQVLNDLVSWIKSR